MVESTSFLKTILKSKLKDIKNTNWPGGGGAHL